MEVSTSKRAPAIVSSYLILRKGDEVCLLLRQNTGYCDGFYGLIAGHVEEGESASMAMRREALEEAGLQLNPSKLIPAHILHRKSERINMDIFFECTSWEGEIINREPHKCAALRFFAINNLPPNTIDYVRDVIGYVQNKICYSERGW